MSKKTLRITLVIVSILYFTIGAPQSSSAATARSTMTTAEVRYHPFFPKSSGNGLQGVLHVQNAGTVDAIFQVDFYTEQGAVVKRYYGTVKPYAAHTLAAEAWAELPVGVYGVRVTSSNGQPLVTVVRVKETNRTVPGLGFDPGVSQSRLATTFHGGPIYGGAKASTIHLFNPTPATVNGEIILRTLTGTPSAPRAWSLPAYGRTSIAFDNQPADFVGTVQITAATAIAALLQQSSVNDGLALQAFNPPALQHFLPRVLKAVAESDGVYTTKLLISNPTANVVSVDVSLRSSEGQPSTTPVALNPNSATFFDLRDLSGVTDGVYEAIINSTAPVILSEITDAINTTANAKATYAGQGFTAITQWQMVESQLFFPRAVRADHGSSSLTLQNSSDSEAALTISAYNSDGTKNGTDLSDRILAKGVKKYNPLSNVSAGFIGSIVISSDRPLVGWMDEVVLTGDEPDPAPAPIDPPAPVASFSAAKRAGMVPLEVQFVNTSQGEYTSNRWDFGDAQSSTDIAPTHTYTQPGVYTVTLAVDGPAGNHTTTKSAYITVRASQATHPDGWDLDFGDGGFVDSDCTLPPSMSTSVTQVTPDNKLLMYLGCDGERKLLRFLADGTLDPSFGVQGQALTINGGRIQNLPVIQSDGKIIMMDYSGLIVRHLANGAYDSTFAPSATTPSQIGDANNLLIQADNQLVIGGTYGVSRFTQDGMRDTTLAGTGYVLIDQILPKPTSEAEQSLLNVAVQPDGKLLLLIETRREGNIFDQTQQHRLVILRLNSNGSLDQSFASAGRFVVFERADINYFSGANYLWVQPNGQLLVAHPIDNRLLRLQPNGALDATFQSPETTFFQQRLVDQHGAIIIQNADELQRFSADGLPDGNFGQNGRLRVSGILPGMTMLQDGSLIVTIRDGLRFKLLRNVKTMNPPVAPVAPVAPPAKPLTLLYAVLDNNLGDGWSRLVNNIEAGVRSDMKVRLLIDGPTDNDVYLYDVQPDTNPFCPSPANPTCNGRYVEGTNFWRLTNENSAHPDSLYQFLVDAMDDYPTADKINLALIGHGSGWSANVLPGQPSIWRDQNDTVGGMLWDDHPATGQQDSRSLSTKALGQALTWAGEQTGRKIDLLYLDGCSMGMAEVAYEVRNGVRYLLAAPNIDWASFNYNALLPEVVNANGRTLGERWLQIEAAEFRANPGHPFTLSLLDLGQMGGVATAASALADSLRALVPTQQAQLLAAFAATDRFDSDYDGDLDTLDAYSDLPAFVGQVKQSFPSATAVQQAAESLRNALDAAVVAKDAAGGSPWLFGEQLWQWRAYGGLGIYLPLGQDEARRRLFYHANNLAWTADTTWDEFLTAFWGGNSNAATSLADMPVCHATTQGCQGLANPLPVQTPTARFVYLPVARK